MTPTFIPVWKQVTPELKAELVAFWAGYGAVADAGLASQRADQVVCICRDADGALVGAASAVVRVLPRLRQPMYYYRHFLAPSVRGQRLTKPFMSHARQVLAEYNAALPRAESLGVLIELESDLLSKSYTRPYEADVDFTFIGYSPRGLLLFVSYFRDAVLLPPTGPAAMAADAPSTRNSGKAGPVAKSSRGTP